MSILTYKIKHKQNFSEELRKARKIAEFALKTKSKSSKDVKHFELPSAISNQILKKYSSNKKLKKVQSVKLTIPNQSIKYIKEKNLIKISCLKFEIPFEARKNFIKINQIELDNKFAYISTEIIDKNQIKIDNFLGIDRNTTGHCAVVALPKTGKVYKLGKKAFHIHRKYKKIRKHLQKAKAYKKLNKIRHRERNIVKDINHKVANKIIKLALENNSGIVLEKLEKIRKTHKIKKGINKNYKKKFGENLKSSINTWEFYQLQQFIEYKSKICGIPVFYVNPQNTSKTCSKCGNLGNRNGKSFSCPNCGHVDHADANAAFNIAALASIEQLRSNDQSLKESDFSERSTDTRQLGNLFNK